MLSLTNLAVPSPTTGKSIPLFSLTVIAGECVLSAVFYLLSTIKKRFQFFFYVKLILLLITELLYTQYFFKNLFNTDLGELNLFSIIRIKNP